MKTLKEKLNNILEDVFDDGFKCKEKPEHGFYKGRRLKAILKAIKEVLPKEMYNDKERQSLTFMYRKGWNDYSKQVKDILKV